MKNYIVVLEHEECKVHYLQKDFKEDVQSEEIEEWLFDEEGFNTSSISWMVSKKEIEFKGGGFR